MVKDESSSREEGSISPKRRQFLTKEKVKGALWVEVRPPTIRWQGLTLKEKKGFPPAKKKFAQLQSLDDKWFALVCF